jgi:hypothetical protein
MKMKSSKDPPTSSKGPLTLNTSYPTKHNLLTLPFETRQNIFDYACAGAEINIRLERLNGGLAQITSYGNLPEYALLLVCKQIYTEARAILAKHILLHINCDFEDVVGYYLLEFMGRSLLPSSECAEFLKYTRQYLQEVAFTFNYSRLAHRLLSGTSLTNFVPAMKSLHLSNLPIGLFLLSSKQLRAVRKILAETRQFDSWRGNVALDCGSAYFQIIQEALEYSVRKFKITFEVDSGSLMGSPASSMVSRLTTKLEACTQCANHSTDNGVCRSPCIPRSIHQYSCSQASRQHGSETMGEKTHHLISQERQGQKLILTKHN